MTQLVGFVVGLVIMFAAVAAGTSTLARRHRAVRWAAAAALVVGALLTWAAADGRDTIPWWDSPLRQ